MPTMIDDSMDDREVKRDISAIIPKFEAMENKDGTELTSKDAILKADGSVILATIPESGEPVITENFTLPEPIDIKARKEEQIKAKIAEKLNKDVIVDWGIDSDIIAGLIFNIDELIIDNSIRHKLDDLSKEIIKGQG